MSCTPSPAPPSPGDSERGAVAVIVALLVVALFGLGALVIDVGLVYQEKSELQSGADAAAIALAYDCLTKGTTTACTNNSTTQAEAEFFAKANTSDGKADVLSIVFDGTEQSVTVRVGTRADDGGDEIDFVLAPVLGTDSATVSAQATAKWGVPTELDASPLAVGLCEWESATNKGDDYGLSIDPQITLRLEATVPFHCLDLFGGSIDEHGGLAYLESNGDCEAVIVGGYSEHEYLLDDPLQALGCVVNDLLFSDYLIVPIFDDVNDGNDPPGACPSPIDIAGIPYCYHIAGYAAFKLANDFDVALLRDISGLDLGGLSLILNVAGIGGVTGIVPILDGNFEEVVMQDYHGNLDPDAPNYGVTAIQLAD